MPLDRVGFRFDTRYLELPQLFYSKTAPIPVSDPELIVLNQDLANEMGLDLSELSPDSQAALFSGNAIAPGAQPFAQAYAGHQFGHFTILGDGRAHVWGEHLMPDGKRVDIQFKGSGRTPYSRGGDGRAVLGPMLREYLISEAMHALGIPTTRSLAVVSTGEEVRRETFLPGAILTRVADSHLRVGTFEFAAIRRHLPTLEALLDYALSRHAPDLQDAPNTALAFLTHVMEQQVDLIVHWMRVGFIHGVMNTDNMTISGETIDYGPCAFMDSYNPETVFSSIDHHGRYAYANQPKIAQWNLARLASTLLPLLDKDENVAIEMAEDVIHRFPDLYHQKWLTMMRAKLGLFDIDPTDEQLIKTLLDWMSITQADYTNTFRDLGQDIKPSADHYHSETFNHWYQSWQKRLAQEPHDTPTALARMKAHNPTVIPRNHHVEEALSAATQGDLRPFHQLVSALKTPYIESDHLTAYQTVAKPGHTDYQTFCGT